MGADMESDFNIALNAMVKRWSAKGIRVWTVREATLFPAVDQIKYALATGGADHATETYYASTLSAAEAASQTILSVTSTTNITVADNIGIVLDSGVLFWTTVSSKTSTTVTVATGITTAAASGNAVFNYTTKMVRPIRVPRARRLQLSSLIETPMRPFSRQEYWDLPNKTTNGTPTCFFYDPQLSSGEFYVWPTPDDSANAVRLTWYRPLQDFTAVTETADIPQEWLSCLVWNLAAELAPGFDMPPPRYAMIKSAAMEKLELVQGWDRESEPIYFILGED